MAEASETSDYVGARGLPPEFIAELEKEFAELEEQLRQKRKRLIVTLADDAIGNGHRNSFARLERLAAEFRNDEELAKEIRTLTIDAESLPNWKEAKQMLSQVSPIRY